MTPMANEFSEIANPRSSHTLRLQTLIRIRSLAVAGQLMAVLVVWLALDFQIDPIPSLILILASVLLNAGLRLRYPTNQLLSEKASTALLSYDIIQLAALLYLTGGLQNPFSILLVVPVVISATALPILHTVFLGSLVVVAATTLVFLRLPIPWLPDVRLELPQLYIVGTWVAIVSSLAFTAIYAFRVADEARKLADALAATELVLQREQHLSNLDGLAAAAAHELGTPLATIALVSKEMSRELDSDSPFMEDARLLRSQAERCREILQTMRSLTQEGDRHISEMPFSAIMEEVASPHRDFDVEIEIDFPKDGNEPVCWRNAGVLYGLGNLIENAVDYAEKKVHFAAEWNEETISITVRDDGSGYDDELLERIGEPFVKSRSRQKSGGGLGLGLFIAKTLLERSGATLHFTNSDMPELSGAMVKVNWQRSSLERQSVES